MVGTGLTLKEEILVKLEVHPLIVTIAFTFTGVTFPPCDKAVNVGILNGIELIGADVVPIVQFPLTDKGVEKAAIFVI